MAETKKIGDRANRLKGLLGFVLVCLLCMASFPVLSTAQATGSKQDITGSLEIKMTYESITAVGDWMKVTKEQVVDGVDDPVKAYRIMVEWSFKDKGHRLAEGDYFTFALDQDVARETQGLLLDKTNTAIGEVKVDKNGNAKALVTALEGTESEDATASGKIELLLDPSVESTDAQGANDAAVRTPSNTEVDAAMLESMGVRGLGGPSGDPNDAGSFGQISLVKWKKASNGCMGGMALDTSGRVWSFGYNLYGELGIGGPNSPLNYYGGMKRVPYFVNNNINVVDIGASYETRYALDDAGKVYAWGDGGSGAMGNGTATLTNYTPTVVPGLPKIKQIFVSDSYLNNASCFALAEDGTLWAWGSNTSGHLGLGNTASRTTPAQVTVHADFTTGVRKVVKVSIGESSSHLLDDKGDLWTVGTDGYGEQGNGSGITASTTFVKMNRTLSGMARVTDVDTSYSRLNGIHDRVVACDEDGNAWEWGHTYGDSGAAAVAKQTPQKIIVSSAEIAAYGYTPRAVSVTSSEMVGAFIDQHGRPWEWGAGYYFGFGREGGYENANAWDHLVKSTAAEQWPKIVGDGDTQVYDNNNKIPVYAGGNLVDQNLYRGYGFNSLHPTVYDEKYMLKDASGYVLDTEGKRMKFVNATSVDGVGGLTRGMYYHVDAAGKVISPATTGTPALNPTDALWINLAFKKVPYIVQLDYSLSAYAFVDADGNLFKWGNDGSGAIAWGWDYDSRYDANGSLSAGLYDRYTYEVMYMRGSPTIDIVDMTAGLKNKVKVYKDPVTGSVTNIAEVKLHIPASVASAELESTVHSDVTELKYAIIPYDTADPNFIVDNTAMTYDQFMAIYNTSESSMKGSLISSTILSAATAQDLTYEVNIPENGRLIVWAVNDRYVDGPGGSKEYQNINNVSASVIADNVYTPVAMDHKGIGVDSDTETQLYAPTRDNVVKTNNDSADTQKPFDATLYGLPLDAHDKVIGATKDINGNVTIDPGAVPTYGYDTVQIKSYEAVGDVGLPAGIKPYWRFKTYLDAGNMQLQETVVQKQMTDEAYAQAGYAHAFYYDHDPNYWTTVEGEKTWVDADNRLGFRPSSVTLTLKQYERNTTTGAKGNYIQDIETITFGVNAQNKWVFSFGSHKSYEYTYEIWPAPIFCTNQNVSF